MQIWHYKILENHWGFLKKKTVLKTKFFFKVWKAERWSTKRSAVCQTELWAAKSLLFSVMHLPAYSFKVTTRKNWFVESFLFHSRVSIKFSTDTKRVLFFRGQRKVNTYHRVEMTDVSVFTQIHPLIWIFKLFECQKWFWQKFCHKKPVK